MCDPFGFLLTAGECGPTCDCRAWAPCAGCPDGRHPACPRCGQPATREPLSALTFEPHSAEFHRCEASA